MLKNRRSGFYASVNGSTNDVVGASKRSGNDIYSQIWIVKPMMPGHYYVSSALNLNYLTNKPEKVSGNMLPLQIFYSGGNASDKASTNYVTITWSNKAEKYENPSFSDANDKTSLNGTGNSFLSPTSPPNKCAPMSQKNWVQQKRWKMAGTICKTSALESISLQALLLLVPRVCHNKKTTIRSCGISPM